MGLKSRGFIIYGLLAALVVAGGLGIVLKVQSSRLAAAQESLAACRDTNAVLNGQIARQNAAVKVLEQEAQERARKAQVALEVARKGQAKAKSEIERLKAAKPPATGCPAAEAVKKVREGLLK